MSGIGVTENKCIGCGLCRDCCPYDAITIENDIAVINSKCSLCGACIGECPYEAIVISRKTFGEQNKSEYSGICLYAEHHRGKLSSVVPEIIYAAKEINRTLKKTISVILLGRDVKTIAEEILSYGADEIWMIEDQKIGEYNEDIHAELISQIILEKKPEIFLGGGTIIGRSLLPRVAVRIPTGLTADCTELSIDEETKLLRQTRPAFGGNIMATILTENHRPQMATVRHKVMKEAVRMKSYDGRILDMSHIPIPESRLEILEFIEEQFENANLAEADYIVSAGRGINDPKNLSVVEELAKQVNGTIGASRAVVDAGWIPYSHQVGQTGKTVNPLIYIACGISGAIQHQAGMKSSDIIIAINNDPNAPIFDIAHYGLVGDLFQVIPELIRQISAE